MIKRLALNTASNLGTLFLKLGITFVMTPVLIKNMGNYDYGLWEMVGAIIGYMGILDLGIRPAVSRFAARFIALKDEGSLTRLYATAWYFLLAVGLILAAIMVFWALFWPNSLAQGENNTGRYTIWLLIIAAQLLVTFPSYVAESFMEAYQEYYLKNNITIVNSILGAAAVLYFITPDNALILLAAVNCVGIISKYLFLVWYVQYKRNFLSFKQRYFSLAQLKELLRFSLKTVVQGLASRMENATDSLLIGFFLGPAIVPLYSVPANLVSYIRLIAMNMTHVFMPYFSSLNASGEQQKTINVYIFGSKLTIAALLVLVIGVLLLGETFLYLWVGGEIAEAASDILWILVAFSALPMLNPFANRYLTAIDRHGFFAKWAPVSAVANISLSMLLVGPMGIQGVALGSLIPSLVFQPIVLMYCCKHLEIRVATYLKGSLLPLLLPSLAMVGVILLLRHYWVIDGYAVLLGIAAIGSLVFLLVGLFFAFNRHEREQLMRIIKPNSIS